MFFSVETVHLLADDNLLSFQITSSQRPLNWGHLGSVWLFVNKNKALKLVNCIVKYGKERKRLRIFDE